MKNVNSIKLTLVTTLILLIMSGCDSGSKKTNTNQPFDPTGKWEYKVTTDVSYGVITITEKGNTYLASMTTEVFGTLEVTNLSIKGTSLTGDLDVSGTPATLKCDFDGDEFTGEVIAGETKFPMEGQRVKN